MPLFLRKPQPIDQFEIATEAGVVAVALRRHPRARNYTLRLKSATGEPVLTMPKRGSLRQAQAFLDRHTGWLLAEMRKLPKGQPIEDGALIPLRGVPHRIRHSRLSRGTTAATSFASEPTIAVAGAREHLRRRVIDFMKREAKRDLESAVLRHATSLGVRPSAIRLRDPTSRWGSCAINGHLSFSWRLIMAPPHVLDYLAAHEVAHLREMNHGPRFWRLVDSLGVDTRAARAWLSAEGQRLHAIGAEG